MSRATVPNREASKTLNEVYEWIYSQSEAGITESNALKVLLDVVCHIVQSQPSILPVLESAIYSNGRGLLFDSNFLMTINRDLLNYSKAQLRQDLFVLSQLNWKKGGFFVEFGATDGLELSNTYLLECKFSWRGILAEPAKFWHSALRNNRTASIDERCVWTSSGSSISFHESEVATLSTIGGFSEVEDGHAMRRRNGITYPVMTVSLLDLLEQHNAPRLIEYLSIDTEGSELGILEAFDFSRYEIAIISCEHNFQPAREAIFQVLSKHGFERRFDLVSQFDDWYVNPSVVDKIVKK